MNMKVNVLGTEYTITREREKGDTRFNDCDGFCDESVEEIYQMRRKAHD